MFLSPEQDRTYPYLKIEIFYVYILCFRVSQSPLDLPKKQNCKVVPQVIFADPPPSPQVVPGPLFGTFLFLNPSLSKCSFSVLPCSLTLLC